MSRRRSLFRNNRDLNFTLIGGSDRTSGFTRLPAFYNSVTRLIKNGIVLEEFPESNSPIQISDFATYNSSGGFVEMWVSNPVFKDTGAASWLTELYFDKMDLTGLISNFSFQKVKMITGVNTLPYAKEAYLINCVPTGFRDLINYSNQKKIRCSQFEGSATISEIAVEDKNLVEHIDIYNVATSPIPFTFSNLPELNYLRVGTNGSGNIPNAMNISNCPKLLTLNIDNFYGRYGSDFTNLKNIDQILIDLDNNGLLNGSITHSLDYVTTSTGDTAKNNLISKGWTITVTQP